MKTATQDALKAYASLAEDRVKYTKIWKDHINACNGLIWSAKTEELRDKVDSAIAVLSELVDEVAEQEFGR